MKSLCTMDAIYIPLVVSMMVVDKAVQKNPKMHYLQKKYIFVYLHAAGETEIMTSGIKGGVTGRWAETAPRLWRTPALCKWPVTASNNIQLKGSHAHLSFFLRRKSYVFSRRRTFHVNLNIWEKGLRDGSGDVHKWDTGGFIRFGLRLF